MARIRIDEEYNNKKDEILKNALTVLAMDGYKKFSVNKVIEHSNMTKGAFFHYYKSKEALVYGMLGLLSTPIVDAIKEIADKNHLNPKEKIIELFKAAYNAKNLGDKSIEEFARLIYLDENDMIRHMLTREVISKCTPIFERVFIEGIEQGIFEFRYPHGTAFHFLSSIMHTNEAIGSAFVEMENKKINWDELKEKIVSFDYLATRLFNLTDYQCFYGDEVLQMIDSKAKV